MAFEERIADFSFPPKFAERVKIGVVCAMWHGDVVERLLDAALRTLQEYKVDPERIIQKRVPGSFEIAMGAQALVTDHNVWGVVCLGCLIRGETHHFHYLCREAMHSASRLAFHFKTYIGWGVLTVDNKEQALARAGDVSNKGREAALSVLRMIHNFS